MSRPKLVSVTILVVVAVVGILQNKGDVQMDFLWMSGAMSLALLLFLTLCVGFVIGFAVRSRKKRRT